MPSPPNDPIPPTISALRRRLISAGPDQEKLPALANDDKSESIDFDSVDGEGLLQGLRHTDQQPTAPTGYDEMEALLARYQAENGIAPEQVQPAASTNGTRKLGPSNSKRQITTGSVGNPARAGNTRLPLPPLTNQPRSELERLKTEVAELRQLNAEYRELLEANDPTVWEQKVADAERCLADRDEQLAAMKAKVDEWEAKFKTHRFVPHDEEAAQMADELDKERAKLVGERKQLEKDQSQLKDDEEGMMKQMRDMEVAMAKDRADLARQRTELQRLQAEVKHELELLQRGDFGVKERLAQFQRRVFDPSARPVSPPPSIPSVPSAPPPSEEAPKPRESAVFKRFFGQT